MKKDKTQTEANPLPAQENLVSLTTTYSDHLDMSVLEGALPGSFDFYSWGSVQLQSALPKRESAREKSGIFYALQGDPKVFITVLLNPSSDLSLYSEMGNIIAAKMSLSLEKPQETKPTVGINPVRMITPPRVLNELELERMTAIDSPQLLREYHHVMGDRIQPFQVLIVLAPDEATGNA